MYAIKYTRITGESGIFSIRFSSKAKAHTTILRARELDRAKRQSGVFEYEVIEI